MLIREAVETGYDKLYKHLTSGDAEQNRGLAHRRFLDLAQIPENIRPLRTALGTFVRYDHPSLYLTIHGKKIYSPIGLAAGFDKNCLVPDTLGEIFDSVEVGTITFRPYEGNPEPNIWVLPDGSLKNFMGFPGIGTTEATSRLKRKFHPNRKVRYLGGVNIGASRPSFDSGTQIEDIVRAYEAVFPDGDYHVLNLSSPNTEGKQGSVRGMQEPEELEKLLNRIDHRRAQLAIVYGQRPLAIKIGPDMPKSQAFEIVDLAKKYSVNEIISTNTTTDPLINSGFPTELAKLPGGNSGTCIEEKSLDFVRTLTAYAGESLPVCGVGGLRDSRTVWNMMSLGGARRVQLMTAVVHPDTSSPYLVSDIKRELVVALAEEGLYSINTLVASNRPWPLG